MSVQTWRYVLVGCGWVMGAVSLPLRCCELNGLFGWRGAVTTGFFLRWIFALPRMLMREGLGGMWGHGVWLAAVVLGMGLFLAAPVLVHRARRSVRGGRVLRGVVPVMGVLALTAVAPAAWGFPVAAEGMWVLAAAQVITGAGLMMMPAPAVTLRG